MSTRLRKLGQRFDENRKRWFEDHIMSRPLPQRLRRWTYGPIPEGDRGKHLFVVLGKRRVERLLWAAVIATWISSFCVFVYELSEDEVRTGSIVVGVAAVAVIARSFSLLRRALHQPSRAHEFAATGSETSEMEDPSA